MITLLAKVREITGKQTGDLRKQGIIPAVLYGPEVKNLVIEVNAKEFHKVLQEAGESSVINLAVDGNGNEKAKKEYQVLVHDLQMDPVKDCPTHIDFYAPKTTEEIEVDVPIVVFGESPAVKELGGTLVKDIHEITVKGYLKDLIKEIQIDISNLKTFEDRILVRDLIVPATLKVIKDPEQIVIYVAQPEKVEEELAKPAEGSVEDVEVVEKEKKEEEVPLPDEGKK